MLHPFCEIPSDCKQLTCRLKVYFTSQQNNQVIRSLEIEVLNKKPPNEIRCLLNRAILQWRSKRMVWLTQHTLGYYSLLQLFFLLIGYCIMENF